jgi:3-hydroxyethyl bacteriochlorophyllide a dehydrogenase
MKTKAIVIPAPNTIELREVELNPLGSDDVLVETTLTSISAGTERMLLNGVMPHPMLQFPVVPGYESVGTVIDAGENAQSWMGKRVYVGGNYGFIGVNPAFGGQSARIVAPTSHLVDLQMLTNEQGVMLALAATAMHGVDLARLCESNSQSVLILGQGVVGLLAGRFAKACGAKVTVTDKVADRLKLSVADEIILTTSDAHTLKQDSLFDVMIDATGKMDAIAPMLMRVKKGGQVILLGYYDCVSLPYQPIFLRELMLVSSAQWANGDLTRARDEIASGHVEIDSLLTHRMKADDASVAFDVAFNDPTCVKMILDWRENKSETEN